MNGSAFQVIWLSGHGIRESGIIMADGEVLDERFFGYMFGTYPVELAVLMHCYSWKLARNIVYADGVHWSIGMSSVIEDDSAIHFTRTFCTQLSQRKRLTDVNVTKAFDTALLSVDLDYRSHIWLYKSNDVLRNKT
ncbi:MAG: hypothetical protein AAF639_46615 [Chloroflexota bacterium]